MGSRIKIRKALLSKGMTQIQLAEKLGRPVGTVRNNLSNDNLKVTTLEEYADALGCDVVLRDRETGELYY